MATTSPANIFPAGVKPFTERRFPKSICMFDVDGTLTPARRDATPEMIEAMRKLREYTATAFVSGSDLVKIQDQLGVGGANGEWVRGHFDVPPKASLSRSLHVSQSSLSQPPSWLLHHQPT